MNVPNEIDAWLREKITEHPWSGVLEPRLITHEWFRATGGRNLRAGLTASIAPANEFSMCFPEGAASREYIPAVRDGAFSVLLCHSFAPILRCTVRFESFTIHETEACYAAFFMASKEVMQRLLGLAPGYTPNIKW
jgi:hypothetical protein